MIHLSDTIHFDPTKAYQKPVDLKRLALPVELLLLLLFLFSSGCANSPGQPSAMAGSSPVVHQSSGGAQSGDPSVEINDQPETCARHTYPKYQDVENQKVVNTDIETGSAQVILHFHELGQAPLDAFLARTKGILEVDSQWPDWGAISITVNAAGLRQLSQDCAIRIIEANKREYPQ